MKQKLEEIILDYLKKELVGKIGVTSGICGFEEKKNGTYKVLDVRFMFHDEDWSFGGYGGAYHCYTIEVELATLKGNRKKWWNYRL